MGLSEFARHDVLMKVPGFPLTRFRLVGSFRRDFENPPLVSLSSSHGNGSRDLDVPDPDQDTLWYYVGSESSFRWVVQSLQHS